jgi:hypothetical protein
VAGHGAGVAEAEVDVVVVVDIGEVRTFGGFDEDGESAGPLFIQFMGTPPRREDWARW